MRLRLWLAIAALAAVAAAGVTARPSPAAPPRPVAVARSGGDPMPTGSPSVAAGAALAFRAADDTAHWYAVASWNAEIDRQRAEADALAREKARAVLATPSPRKSPSTSPGMSSHGPHSDAWWVGVAICEQGRNGRPYNAPYFGYFSIMDGSASGLDWATQVSMANAIIARYGDGAWAASCVAKGYAAAPGG